MSEIVRHLRAPIRWRLLSGLWTTPLVAVPFAIFFGTLYGRDWDSYVLTYKVSLVMSVVIGYAGVLLDEIADRNTERLQNLFPTQPWAGKAVHYMVGNVIASYLGAFLVNQFVMPGYLGGPRAWAVSGLFTILFVLLFGGLFAARNFYRVAQERAAAVERVRGELARAELRALRAQINPHFLFNTLNTIAALIAENPRAAEDVVTQLADVFRYALTSAEHETSRLGDELAFVRAYLQIESVRLGERLRVDERIEPGLDAVRVPSLLLQPLVENAVRYAVTPRTEGGRIALEARRAGDRLVLVVADDGPGLDTAAAPSGHGLGLASVRDRLRLAGAGHALHVDTAPGRGTRFTIELPFPPAEPARDMP